MFSRVKLLASITVTAVLLFVASSLSLPKTAITYARLLTIEQMSRAANLFKGRSGETGASPDNIRLELASLRAENMRLKEALYLQGFVSDKTAENFNLIIGEVVKNCLPKEPLLIVKARDSNISKGCAVMHGDSVVGIVDSCNAPYYTVVLSTHTKFKCAAYLFNGERRARGVCKGSLSELKMRLPVQALRARPFSAVYTSADNKRPIPADFMLGELSKSLTLKTGEIELKILPVTELATLQTVIIATAKK